MTGTYTPIIKTLVRAIPIIRSSDNVVLKWNLIVNYRYEGSIIENLPEWENNYEEDVIVENLNKTINDFTKQELVELMGQNIENSVFHIHYESFNLNQQSSETIISDFNIDTLT